MKFFLPALLLTPAVMGRACRPASSSAPVSSQEVVSTAILPIASSSSKVSTTSAAGDSGAEEVTTTVQSIPQTTLVTAVHTSVSSAPAVASSSSSTSSVASSSQVSIAAAAEASSSTSSSSSTTSSDSSSSSVEVLSSTKYTGTSTFYGGNLSGGTCMFTTYTLPSSIYGTAYSGEVWDSAAECGACIEITGPSGTVKAMIVDECPECDQGHLDLFPSTFTAIGGTDGTVSTSYQFVKCGITSPLVLHNKSGTSEYWFSMQVVNHNVPVESLEVSTDGGSTWTATTRTDYNFFEYQSGFGTDTMEVRVTSTTGETITVSNVGTTSDAQYTATSNFA